jgi:acetylornithine deacetylase/succinyl-diaminopimelate desuccinylase-like protein
MDTQRLEAIKQAATCQETYLNTLVEFLRIPSISTDPDHNKDMDTAAEWVMKKLIALGMENVKKFPTQRHPIIYGEYLGAPDAATILVYGHYDVQPADPLELWNSGPFEPTIRGENLYARGASDMKGQIAAILCALEAIRENGKMPVNLKWLIEGEEEIGSPNLGAFINDHKDLLKSDFALNPDAGMIGKDAPTVTYGLRGLAYFEIRVQCAATDLHSGIFGGILHNPAIALAELIAGMHDAEGRITLPGFYDKVRQLTQEERDALARIPTDEKFYLEMTGAPALAGEAGYTPNELTGARPTLDVNGFLSGFTGPGSKTVIPAKAMAKISMRLVPDQDPQDVHKQLRQYLEEKAAKDIRWELIEMHGGKPSISDLNNSGVRAYAKALETVWGISPYFKREGGSVPVVAAMQDMLGIESVIGGFGLPDDNYHAPNEKLHLPTWYKGIEALIHFFMNLKT